MRLCNLHDSDNSSIASGSNDAPNDDFVDPYDDL